MQPDLLATARAAYAERRWEDARCAYSEADRLDPLGLDDLEKMGLSAGLSGHDAEMLAAQERLHDRALAAGQPERAARAAFWIGYRLWAMGEMARSSGWMATAQRDVDGVDSAVHGLLRVVAAQRTHYAGDFDGAIAQCREAHEIGRRFGDREVLALARSVQGRSLLYAGRVPEGLALLDEVMVDVSRQGAADPLSGVVYCTVIACCHRVFALDRAREWTDALSAWVDSQPQLVPFTGICLVHRSEILQLSGAWPSADEEARRAEERLARIRDPMGSAEAHYQRAEIHRLRGEFAAAEEGYVAAARKGGEVQPGLALLRLAQGRADVAVSALRRVLDATTQPLLRPRFLPAFVEALLVAGDVAGAEAAAGELDDAARTCGTELLQALALHARGAVRLAAGDASGAVPLLQRALGLGLQLGTPYLAARTRVLLGRACQSLGDADGGELAYDLARETFVELGARPDIEALPSKKAATPQGLTPREVEVLRLVAEGRTNKDIGKALFVSERTVDRHVSNLFAKLGVSTRAAATSWAWEHGLAGGRG